MPQKFTWDENLDVGIKSINEQHQHFIEIANHLLDMTDKESINKDELEAVIEELEKYAFFHLETEENYFEKYGYDGAPPHIAAHDQYRETVKKLVEKVDDPETDVKALAQECALFSAKWLIKHIQVMDKQYTVFFQEKGVN